jgi:hypothetical protein
MEDLFRDVYQILDLNGDMGLVDNRQRGLRRIKYGVILSLVGMGGLLGSVIRPLPCLRGVFAALSVCLVLGAIPLLCGVYEFATKKAWKNIPSIVRVVILVVGITSVFFLALVVAQSIGGLFRH